MAASAPLTCLRNVFHHFLPKAPGGSNISAFSISSQILDFDTRNQWKYAKLTKHCGLTIKVGVISWTFLWAKFMLSKGYNLWWTKVFFSSTCGWLWRQGWVACSRIIWRVLFVSAAKFYLLINSAKHSRLLAKLKIHPQFWEMISFEKKNSWKCLTSVSNIVRGTTDPGYWFFNLNNFLTEINVKLFELALALPYYQLISSWCLHSGSARVTSVKSAQGLLVSWRHPET